MFLHLVGRKPCFQTMTQRDSNPCFVTGFVELVGRDCSGVLCSAANDIGGWKCECLTAVKGSSCAIGKTDEPTMTEQECGFPHSKEPPESYIPENHARASF